MTPTISISLIIEPLKSAVSQQQVSNLRAEGADQKELLEKVDSKVSPLYCTVLNSNKVDSTLFSQKWLFPNLGSNRNEAISLTDFSKIPIF